MTEATTLYRAYDDAGRLLYVGIAQNWARRWAQHSERAPWFRDVARLDLATHPSRAEAERAERQAIVGERPLHNVVHALRPAVTAAGDDGRPRRREGCVRSFDHTHLRHLLAEYAEVARAVDALIKAARPGDFEAQEDVAEVVATIARNVPYGDGCNDCMRSGRRTWIGYPVAASVEGGYFRGMYACTAHQRVWRRSYSVDLPAYFIEV